MNNESINQSINQSIIIINQSINPVSKSPKNDPNALTKIQTEQIYGVGGFGSFASLLNYNSSCYYNTKSSTIRRPRRKNKTINNISIVSSSRKKDNLP
jgi:hypothetical protein